MKLMADDVLCPLDAAVAEGRPGSWVGTAQPPVVGARSSDEFKIENSKLNKVEANHGGRIVDEDCAAVQNDAGIWRWLAWVVMVVGRGLVRLLYRVQVKDLENLPRTGGVVVVANHVSYLDAVLLSAVSPRPLRAVAWGGFQQYPFMRLVFRLFGCLPVTKADARTGLREAVRALRRGEAVLIFPEGHITRTGGLGELESGYGLLARRAGVPVVPVWLGGLWGSVFSFAGGRFFWKRPRRIPYPVTIQFGAVLAPGEATAEAVRRAWLGLAAPTFSPVNHPASTAAAAPLVDFGEAEFRLRPEFAGHLGPALVAALQKNAHREVLVDCMDKRKSYTGAKILAAALALAGRVRGTIPESRVGIVLPPGAGGLIANLAVVFAGKTPVNLNFTVGRAGLELCLRKSGVRTTLSADIFRRKLEERIPGLPWSERVLDVGRELAALPKATLAGWLVAARFLPAAWVARLAGIPRAGGDREAALLFTSGSAGEPKGVVLTHRNILGNCGQIDASGILPGGETLLANLPIFHSFGFTVILWYGVLRGLRLVTVPSPLDTRKCIEAIRAEKVTALVGTPTFLRPYLKRVAPGELASLKYAIAGAEKTPTGFAAEWEAQVGGEYFEGYGLTETSPVVAVNLPASLVADTARKRPGSVGRLFAGMAARVVDPDTGAERGRNETGLLLLRGLNVFPGYLDQPEATAAAFRDGWFVTGDLARIDDDGFIFIEGRLSRFSKIGGEMVPHGTVEQAVLQAYGLQEQEGYPLAVSARLDAAKGEALVLLVTMEIEPADLVRRLGAAGLPNLWIPRVIKRVDAIPVLASGKLDLRKLKELAGE